MKTHKKDTGKQNRKRSAEAAGSFTQVAHDGGNAVKYNATQPFRATGKIYNGSKFGVAGDLLC
jgi:hypothetical protein